MVKLADFQANQPVSHLPMVGPGYVEKLEKLQIHTFQDLLHHYPYRYQDSSITTSIASLQPGEAVTLQGMILSIKTIYTRTGKTIQRAQFSDGTGVIELVWFNQPYLVQTFTKNPHISISGIVKAFHSKRSITAPQFEFLRASVPQPTTTVVTPIAPRSSDTIHTGRLVPIYSETAGVSSKWLRSRIHVLLHSLPTLHEWLPDDLIARHRLITYDHALRQIHFPESSADAQQARFRLSFDELFLWQLRAQTRKRQRTGTTNYYPVSHCLEIMQPVIAALPFQLTSAQQKVLAEIAADLQGTSTMNRLVQGDVGSGKTVVAALAAYSMAKSGFTTIVMAPTELLAHQHFKTMSDLLIPFGLNVAAATRTHKADVTKANVVVGTHAVLFRELPPSIGLIVIDEQHRFGVEQRGKLLNKPQPPHLLSMTATPIPRTVALTLHADLDVSVIDELPAGRKLIKTKVVTPENRQKAYDWLRQLVQAGNQIYIVCPLVEESDAEGFAEVKAAEAEFSRLKQEVFPELKLGLVHGQMKSKDKDAVIQSFANKELDILVATPVIEVGIDIPNATVMLIEGAERFGLAQLHQLRGRVGRGDKQSYCLLFPTHTKGSALPRLRYMETVHSGFELANIDLKLRGPGDVFGTQQSGFIDLRIATLDDEQLIRLTHQEAVSLLNSDPDLESHPLVKAKLETFLNKAAPSN